MTWLIVGILPPILWALVNHTDKYLLSRTTHKSSVNVLMIYSTGFSIVVLPILFFLARVELFTNLQQVWVQIVGGILITLSIYFYLTALNKDEASVVMPLALLVPVFGFILSYFVLGEILTTKQIIACFLVIGGAAILSLEFKEERKIRIRHGVLIYMILCTFFQAAQETLFKLTTINNPFIVSVFWLHIGILICGIGLIVFKPGLLGEFINSARVNGKTLFGVNLVSEVVSSVAYMIRDYAILLAPVAIVMSFNGYQPAFVFIFGIILTIFAPNFVKEKIRLPHLLHKTIAIFVIIVGTVLIAQTLG